VALAPFVPEEFDHGQLCHLSQLGRWLVHPILRLLTLQSRHLGLTVNSGRGLSFLDVLARP